MAFQSKTKRRSFARSIPTAAEKEYGEMSISELVTVLRTAYKTEDFDKIEQELVKREAKLRAEIGPLREKIELERLNRIEVEGRLRLREEQCEKGKRAQDNYEQLLKEVKTGGLVEKHAIEELRKKNVALQREVYELKEFRKKMLDDVKSMNELRDKIRVLKEEKVRDKNALDVLTMRNTEVEEVVKKTFNIIEGLKNENGKLTETFFESLDRRYGKLRVSDVKLGESTMPLMSEDPSNCGNTEVEPNLGASFAVKDEKDVSGHELENDTWEPVSLQRDEDTHYSVDTGTCQSRKKGNKEGAVGALGVKFKVEKEIVDLSDDEDDDDKYTSQGLQGEKAISQIIEENEYPQWVEIIKRKRASDIEASISTSTSSADLFEKENLPVKKTLLATPTPGTPLVSSPSLSLSWQSSKVLVKKLRGSTRLRTLTRRIGVKRLQVYIDAATGRPSGPNRLTFTSYLGALAREKVSILHPSWDQVNESTKKLLWWDILAHFDIVPSEAIRGKTLSSIASTWRRFKTHLATRWALNEDKINRGMTPCNMYGINEDTWRQFVQIRYTASLEKKRKIAQEVEQKNDTPHWLSREGYRVLEEKLMAEKIKLREEQTSEFDIELQTNTSPPSPPSRHVKWKRARMTSSGQFTSESALQIAKRPDSLEMQSKQGMFHPSGRQDILATAIGRPEHPGYVRAAGKGKKDCCPNNVPHVLSRGGYALLDKKMRKSCAEDLGLESPDLVPPPARYEMWKAVRTKSDGQMTSQSAQQISQRILVEQEIQGSHVSQGRKDILTTTIGKLDHPGRIRGIGGTIGIKDYFGPKEKGTKSLRALRKLELQMQERLNKHMTVMEQRFMEQDKRYLKKDLNP